MRTRTGHDEDEADEEDEKGGRVASAAAAC